MAFLTSYEDAVISDRSAVQVAFSLAKKLTSLLHKSNFIVKTSSKTQAAGTSDEVFTELQITILPVKCRMVRNPADLSAGFVDVGDIPSAFFKLSTDQSKESAGPILASPRTSAVWLASTSLSPRSRYM